ncbi:MAG TPA: glycoside hydrolase family 2, partial [Puia sp.]|nr:glycoside hydrolase family 2 [Puia sp.]
MKQLLFIVICLPLFVDAQPAAVDTHAWQPASLTLPTRWSKSVSPSNALPEYPRPQLVRGEWQNLNGLWDYSITDSASAEPKSYAGQILVPYPLESALSGVKGALRPEQRLWYRRDLAIGSLRKERRYLLHFGAVDYQATVYVNGKAMGQHTGGYQEFTIDISGALHKGTNRLTVAVLDPTDKGNNPHGKQTLDPKGIWYTPSSGIWQTVWLETVPTVYIEGLELTPDVDNGVLKVKANVKAAGKGYTVEAVAFSGSAMTGSVKGAPG